MLKSITVSGQDSHDRDEDQYLDRGCSCPDGQRYSNLDDPSLKIKNKAAVNDYVKQYGNENKGCSWSLSRKSNNPLITTINKSTA